VTISGSALRAVIGRRVATQSSQSPMRRVGGLEKSVAGLQGCRVAEEQGREGAGEQESRGKARSGTGLVWGWGGPGKGRRVARTAAVVI